jgi:predicted peptidase
MSHCTRHSCLWFALAIAIAGPLRDAAGEDAQPAGTQAAKTFEKEVLVKVKLNYLLYLPKEYGSEKKSWPMLVFLHGSGESGSDLNKVKVHGPPKLIAEGKDFPFIVVSPQSSGRGWDSSSLNGLVDDITSKYQVDKNRIYLTGLSMGGFGTWSLAAAYPAKFAAIAPICGGGNTDDATKIKDLPIWVFHGAQDTAVPLKRSADMVEALKEAGSKSVEFTVYPEAGHDSWTETYNNPDLYTWFLKHSLKGN